MPKRPRETTLLLAGDLMLGRGVNASLESGIPGEEPWSDLLPWFHVADLRIVNLECAITPHETRWSRSPKAFYFGAAPGALRVLQAAKIDAVALANNHTLDFEEEGLIDTLVYLDRFGIAHAGAGRNLSEARKPVLIPIGKPEGQRKFALLSATDNEPEFAATRDRPGTNYFPIDLDSETLAWLGDAVADSRARGAEVVVLSLHWGPNMIQRPSSLFQKFAEVAIDRGVDIVHGHSSHLFQGIQIYKGKPILYDTGDLLDDYAVDPELRNDWSFLFLLNFEGKEFRSLRLVPVKLEYCESSVAKGTDRRQMLARMKALSSEFGTRLQEDPDGTLFLERPRRAA